MKNSNVTTGNRTRDLPACSAVPQPTAPPRTPFLLKVKLLKKHTHDNTSTTAKGRPKYPDQEMNVGRPTRNIGVPPSLHCRADEQKVYAKVTGS